jgi:hypothetical protein
VKPDKKKLQAVFKDIGRLFGKLHTSNSDQEILMAVKLLNKKLESSGLHIADLGQFLQAEGEDLMSLFAKYFFSKDQDVLIDLARSSGKFFCTRDGISYTDIVTATGHRQTMPIGGIQFQLWLRHEFYKVKKTAPTISALKNCVATLEADAHFGDQSERHEVFLRTARVNDSVFLDLGDPEWRVIEIAPSG